MTKKKNEGLATRDLLDVEIAAVGTWPGSGCPPGGCEITKKKLDQIVDSYKATKDEFHPPAKLGHDEEQKLLQTDGYPAAGWLTNIRREGEKLFADIMKVPNVLADLIDAGAYRERSIELQHGYDVSGTVYDVVLTGLAFLGDDIPAIKGLKDMAKLYASQNLSMPEGKDAHIVVFTADKKLDFQLPKGMSYNELHQQVVGAFCDANPAAEPYNCYVMDLFEDYAILDLSGKWWKQNYQVSDEGVVLKGLPSQVDRKTRWEPVKADKYADEAKRLLVDVKAFTDRTKALVSLRTEGDGKELSETRVQLIESVRDTLSSAVVDLQILTKPTPKVDQKLKLRQALFQTEMSLVSLQES